MTWPMQQLNQPNRCPNGERDWGKGGVLFPVFREKEMYWCKCVWWALEIALDPTISTRECTNFVFVAFHVFFLKNTSPSRAPVLLLPKSS